MIDELICGLCQIQRLSHGHNAEVGTRKTDENVLGLSGSKRIVLSGKSSPLTRQIMGNGEGASIIGVNQ